MNKYLVDAMISILKETAEDEWAGFVSILPPDFVEMCVEKMIRGWVYAKNQYYWSENLGWTMEIGRVRIFSMKEREEYDRKLVDGSWLVLYHDEPSFIRGGENE